MRAPIVHSEASSSLFPLHLLTSRRAYALGRVYESNPVWLQAPLSSYRYCLVHPPDFEIKLKGTPKDRRLVPLRYREAAVVHGVAHSSQLAFNSIQPPVYRDRISVYGGGGSEGIADELPSVLI